MELDPRIIKGKRPLTCFDTEQAKEFLGKECYFSNCKSHYKNLSAFEKYETLTDYCIGTLTAVMDLGDRVFDVDQQCKEFRYCLPCEWVKEPEKKYRAFTLAEWIDQYEIGDIIRYRCKSQKIELCHMYVGYAYGIGTDIKNTTSGTLTLGVASYTLDYLFEDYEICIYGEWQPFGVLDE